MPSSASSYNAGEAHNSGCNYLIINCNPTYYASDPAQGFDSLMVLFARDSITTSNGQFSSQILLDFDTTFDSVFSGEIPTTHSWLQTSINKLVTDGGMANDEANFIRNADSLLRLCSSFAELNDTLTSLRSQYNGTMWTSSKTNGTVAYAYLSVADSSATFWGPGGAGSNGWNGHLPKAQKRGGVRPLSTSLGSVAVADAVGFAIGFCTSVAIDYMNGGWTNVDWGKAFGKGLVSGVGASLGALL